MAVNSHNAANFIMWKMLPPGDHFYYFTVNGEIKLKDNVDIVLTKECKDKEMVGI